MQATTENGASTQFSDLRITVTQVRPYVLAVTHRSWGVERSIHGAEKAKMLSVDQKAEGRLSLRKKLLDAKELQLIRQYDDGTNARLALRYNRCPFMAGAGFFVTREDIGSVRSCLAERAEERKRLVEMFLLAYPGYRDEALRTMPELFRADDYPSVDRVRASFSLRYTIYQLDGVDDTERSSIDAQIQDALQVAGSALRRDFRDLLARLSTQLAVDAQGKKAVFRDTLPKALTDFFAGFPTRNGLLQDTEMSSMVRQLQSVCGVDADAQSLRNNLTYRARVQGEAERLLRCLTLDDDDASESEVLQ